MYILDEKELIPFTFRLIDILLNNLETNNKFRKKKAFNTVKSFARLRKFDIVEDVYTFKINDKSFIVSFFTNDIPTQRDTNDSPTTTLYFNNDIHNYTPALLPTHKYDIAKYFHLDRYYYNDNKLIYLFVPVQDKYYSYEDDNLDNIIHSVIGLFRNNDLLGIHDIFNHDIRTVFRFQLMYIVLLLLLYFTLEDNKDTKHEVISKYIMKYYYDIYSDYIILYDDIYDKLFDGVENIMEFMTDSQKEQIITKNYFSILDNIMDYIVPVNKE